MSKNMVVHTTVLSAIEVIFGANGEVAPGERIVTLEPEEASPWKKSCQRFSRTWEGSCLTITLFLLDFNGATAGRGGMGGVVVSPLGFVVVTFEAGPSGRTEEGGVEAP